MPEPRAIAVNPANTSQALVLWSDGRVVPRGPGTPDPHFNANWDRGSWNNIGRDIVVTDWVTPSGYVLSGWGSIQRFGTATAPDALGIRAPDYKIRNDFWWRLFMDPGGSGGGYQVSKTGLVYHFGGAPSVTAPVSIVPGGLAGFGSDAVRGFDMQWSTKKFVILDRYGGIHRGGGLAAITLYDFSAMQAYFMKLNKTKVKFDLARAIQVVDWGATPKGYVLDAWGGIHDFGGALAPAVKPSWPMTDMARDLVVSSYPTNFQYTILTKNGTNVLVNGSTPPAVTITAPVAAATITNSTRPTISWEILDAQGDPQDSVTIKVFSSAQYSAGGFSPDTSASTWETTTYDRRVRSVQPSIDLTNGTYRAYVKVIEPLGLSSGWVNTQWTLNVTPPPAPTWTSAYNQGNTIIGGFPNPPLRAIDLSSTAAVIGMSVEVQYAELQAPFFTALGPWKTLPRIADGITFGPSGGNSIANLIDDELQANRAYRFRIIDTLSGDDNYKAGPWLTTTTQTYTNTAKPHWLIAVDYKTQYNWALAVEIGLVGISETQGRSMGLFRPLGSNAATVVSDTGRWEETTLDITIKQGTADVGYLNEILKQPRFALSSAIGGDLTYLCVNGEYSIEYENAKTPLLHYSIPCVAVSAD